MPREIIRRAEAVPATSMIALAIGAAAFALGLAVLVVLELCGIGPRRRAALA